MKTVVILPTYNEKENISILIPKLLEAFKLIKNHKMHILVVDDKSPDNTADAVKLFQKKSKNIELISGDKQGLGVAYLRGFKHAIENMGAETMIMMDADLSHPPELIPQFMKRIDEGNDFVIGSRYVKGGDTPDWNFKRKFISRAGNFFARIVSGIYNVHDCTSGFRAIRVSMYKKIQTENLHTRGYAFLTTLLYELISSGAKVKEIPLVFYDRKFGETKLQAKDMREFFFNAFRLRFKSSKRMIKYLAVGGSGIFVNLGLFSVFKIIFSKLIGDTTTSLLAASFTGDEFSILYNFVLNHIWTYKGSTNDEHLIKKLFKFHLVAITSVIISNLIMFSLHSWLGVWDIFAKFIGILAAFIWNYFVNSKWTWREKI
jgi:dolichol-phosphate mannosyltransferase